MFMPEMRVGFPLVWWFVSNWGFYVYVTIDWVQAHQPSHYVLDVISVGKCHKVYRNIERFIIHRLREMIWVQSDGTTNTHTCEHMHIYKHTHACTTNTYTYLCSHTASMIGQLNNRSTSSPLRATVSLVGSRRWSSGAVYKTLYIMHGGYCPLLIACTTSNLDLALGRKESSSWT